VSPPHEAVVADAPWVVRVAPGSAAELARLRAALRAVGGRSLDDVARRRAAFEAFAARLPGREPGEVTAVTAGGVPALLHPGAAARGAVLYLHGGAYTYGSPESHRDLARRLGAACGLPVLVPDYRLAPEHAFPAALEDAAAALRWLQERHGAVVVAGDSAGGGLAVACALRAREEGGRPPAGLVALSPWTDLALTGASIDRAGRGDPLVDRESLCRAATAYLAGRDPRDPGASPLFADLAGLPPLLVQVAGGEALEDDATRLAAGAHAAGVAVTLEIWDGQPHVWHLYAGVLGDGARAIGRAGAFARRACRASHG
jgi:acetyl esterase/lipase